MKNYKNPIIPTSTTHNTSDPYVLYHEGYYYHCYYEKDGIYLAKSSELTEIGNVKPMNVYSIPQEGHGSNWYAPELHFVNGVWYIYGSPETNKGLHTMHVISRQSRDPMGAFSDMQEIKGLGQVWCLDGTILECEKSYYFIWSYGDRICMAKMFSPTEISSEHILLVECTHEFEKRNGRIIEGPAILKHNGKIHLIYSTNDSQTDDYCLGMVTFAGGEITNAANWIKTPKAVFERTETIFGPGHCSFTKVEEEDYMVYHANLATGSGWGGRSVWLQKVEWDEKDMPIFGQPHF